MSHRNTFQIIGHRGAAAHAPENTLISFQTAIDMGATMLELDVHLSKDRELIVIHDPEITRTTSGSGYVSDLAFADILRYDAGSWKDPVFEGEKVPTLQDVLKLAQKGTYLNIELKAGEQLYDGLVDKTLDAIREFGVLDMIIISSFHREYLEDVKQKSPDLEVALLYSTDIPDVLREVAECGWEGLHPHFHLVDENLVETARELGLCVRPWTVNETIDMERFIRLGVDGVITDYPDVLKASAAGPNI
ncbi:MAG: glycerophosphodiester phosphodiesterase [Firmicutes bacterium]|nr:glycerophosphodiester phosphodiesterase [Bacillota bacterium]